MLSGLQLISGGSTIAVAIATIAVLARKQKTDGKATAKETRIDDPKTSLLRKRLKAELTLLLSEHNGCTKDKDVVEVVEKLAAINPVPRDCSRATLFLGEYFTLSAPPFPGKIENDNKNRLAQFTLGRLSFNIFQPKNLVCTVKSICNPVSVHNAKNDDSSHVGTEFTYNFIVDLIIHAPSNEDSNNDQHRDIHNSDIEATIITKGFCRPSPDVNNRMMVTFTGSSLFQKKKSDKATKLLWNKKFANAYRKADRERSYSGWMLHYGLKWFLGLTYPDDADALDKEHEFSFKMKYPFSSYFDVLYLDEDIRITKGSRGTIVVVDRMKDSTTIATIS